MGSSSASMARRGSPPPRPLRREHLLGVIANAPEGIRVRSIDDALQEAGEYLGRSGKTITIVAVGGIVDGYLLDLRQPVYDMLFFNPYLSDSDMTMLKWALGHGEKTFGAPVNQACNDPEAKREMGFDLPKVFTDFALENDLTLLDSGGLKVVACPISYHLICLWNRIRTRDERQYDWENAMGHLRWLIRGRTSKKCRSPRVSEREIDEDCDLFQKKLPPKALFHRVNKTYRNRHLVDAISVNL